MSQPITFLAKHPFQGDARQSQISFPKGATLNAKANQTGAWWWGSYNGKEGWFPPTYVTALAAAAPPQAAPQLNSSMSMQQRMQSTSFAPSSVKQRQQQQQQASFPVAGAAQSFQQGASVYGQQPQPTAYGAQGITQSFQVPQQQQQSFSQSADPFAGLPNLGLSTPAAAPTIQQNISQPPPISSNNMSMSTISRVT